MSVVRVLRHGHEVDQIAELNICNNISGFVVGLVANQRNIIIWFISHQLLVKQKACVSFQLIKNQNITNNEKLSSSELSKLANCIK